MKSYSIRITAFFALVLLFQAPAFCATLLVPQAYPTIQAAIDAANPYDLVLVAPDSVNGGPYVENLRFPGFPLVVKSRSGAALTTIDGGSPSDSNYGSAVRFDQGDGADSVIDGFTITNGTGTYLNDPPYVGFGGGGIACFQSSPTIRNNVITSNAVSEGGGGGIMCFFSAPAIYNNIVHNNSLGGDSSGGGIGFIGSTNPKLVNNVIVGNTAAFGAGISFLSTTMSTFDLFQNNSVVENIATEEGGGVEFEESSSAKIENSILWGNSASIGKELAIYNSSSVTIQYCDIDGAELSVAIDSGSSITPGPGLINANPQFQSGPLGNYYLDPAGPCVNTGNSLAPAIWVDSLTTMDILTTRADHLPDSGTVDMGYHHISEIGARFGNVNLGSGSRWNMLFINGNPGDSKRIVNLSPSTPFFLNVSSPLSGPLHADYVIFAIPWEAGLSDLARQPFGFGMACIPMPLSNLVTGVPPYPPPYTIANTVGHTWLLGNPLLSAGVTTTPCSIPMPGIPTGTYTIQGYILDNAAVGPNISLTNGIVLKVQ